MKNYVKNIILRHKASSESFIKYLRSKGVKIGERTTFFSPHQISVDIQYPWLIEIGDDVQLTGGVRILTHDYSWSVLKRMYGEVLGAAGKVKIGNNVFIGSDTVLLKNTDIGNNVIIGARSVVNKRIPDNCVASGNPCKVIMTIEEFYKKRKLRQFDEAKCLAQAYFERTGQTPPKEIFHEFFFLFENAGIELNSEFKHKLGLVGNYEETEKNFREKQHLYDSFEEFLEACNLK